ncbi:pyridoxal-phosphate-dependent aminotransferase family protein [Herbinix luporum]|uniref:pyridoxal-phosphate-dependent aminotransferase family protein n=1 Tax=Herbinix luporum TaxID=1679721 RepID=UPI001751F9FA|nr:aminotransferase class V-fold PLP-dependent enzyme [Herbinix luporum]HHT57292.1 alanine--glyoxylate aminotransferase family protein [Herbinix luporum]
MKLFTVGPVEMYSNTLTVAAQQLPYFRTDEFSQIMLNIDSMVKELLNTPSDYKSIYLTTSGTGAMEAAVINCFSNEDKLLIVSGGTFGERFEHICRIHNIPYEALTLQFGEILTEEKLSLYDNKGFTGLLINIHETSTGQLYPIKLVSDFCKRNNMFLVVDAISSFLADYYNMLEFGIDVTIFSSHKALALSPGISVVVLSNRIYENKVKNNNCNSLYFNFNDYIENMKRGQTPFTPAVGVLLELHDMLINIKSMGLSNKIEQTYKLAEDFRKKIMEIGYEMPTYPLSNALTPVIFKGNAKEVFHTLKDKYKILVTPSGGKLEKILLRVGHLGNLTEDDNTSLIKALKEIS